MASTLRYLLAALPLRHRTHATQHVRTHTCQYYHGADYGCVFLRFSFSPGGNGAGLHRLGNYHRHEGQARKHRQV